MFVTHTNTEILALCFSCLTWISRSECGVVCAGMMTAKVSGVSGWKEVEPNVWERVKAGSTRK